MKKIFILLNFIIISSFTAQEIDSINNQNSIYNIYKLESSIPTYKLSKIQKILSKSGEENTLEGRSESVKNVFSDKDFDKLEVKEKFTYLMVYPENLLDNKIDSSFNFDKKDKIFAYLPSFQEGNIWSTRQINFLRDNRKEILTIIKEYVSQNLNLGLNYKLVLEELNATEMIPSLIDFYEKNNNEDKEILTLLMLITKANKYYPFTRSNIHSKLYTETNNFNNVQYLDDTEENEEYIIKTAQNFYSQLPRKNKTLK